MKRKRWAFKLIIVIILSLGLEACGPTPLPESPSLDMVYVTTGEFKMGSIEGPNEEQPVHIVYLNAYSIDKTEVTNAQYRECVEVGECEAPSNTTYYDKANFTQHPVVYINWYQAKSYCQWAGKRLPTEAEWEKAARGMDGRTYPWGNDFDCHLGNFDDEQWIDIYVVAGGPNCDKYMRTAPVGSFPNGASPYGALDMAGNVWEWVADWYNLDYYSNAPSRNPKGPDSGTIKVLRGGSWHDNEFDVRATNRFPDHPAGSYGQVGFRCAQE